MLSRRESGGSRARAPVKESMTCAGATNVFAPAHCAERNPPCPPSQSAYSSSPRGARTIENGARMSPPFDLLLIYVATSYIVREYK